MPPINLKQRVLQGVNPIVEGDAATFVWLGENPPILMGEMNHWDETRAYPLEKQSKGVYAVTVTLPKDGYFEYLWFAKGEDGFIRQLDPLNPRKITNGVGGYNNFFSMPDYVPTPYTQPKRGVARGTVTRHLVTNPFFVGGGKRDVWLYQPPVSEPVPLVLVYDGHDYVYRAKLPVIVDNLIAEGAIRPIALALVENASKWRFRFTEYCANEGLLVAIIKEVLPLAKKNLNLLDIEQHPGAYGVLGASMGGLMATYTGMRLPHIFGQVVSQSGAFLLSFLDNAPTLVRELMTLHQPPLKIYQDCGRYEWLIDTNREMHAFMKEKGMNVVTYNEYNGGHNYTCWRNQLPLALKSVFGVSHG